MDKEKIDIDELLGRQSALPHRATIKPAAADRVVITPAAAGGKCACAHGITVEKGEIEAVTPTGDVHACCGKTLLVVEVEFVNKTVAEIFRQLSERATRSSKIPRMAELLRRGGLSAAGSPFGSARLLRDDAGSQMSCYDKLSVCTENCSWLEDPTLCEANCREAFRICQILQPYWYGY